MNQMPRNLNFEDIKEITSLTRKDITATKLKELFAIKEGFETAKYLTNDKFTLQKNMFFNKQTIPTTVGRYLFNMFCVPEVYLKKFGYINEPLFEDFIKDIEKQMGRMILEDEMTTMQYSEFMDNSEWLAMSMSYYNTPSLSLNMILPIPEVIKRKNELFDQYQEQIKAGDNNAANIIEKELLTMARTKVESLNDPSYDLFKSGVFNFNVSYKKDSIMIGAIANPLSGKLDILKSNYTDGVSIDEYDKAAALTMIGGYSRGVSTQKYGYETKKYNSSLQNVMVDIDDTDIDCGTKLYLETIIEPEVKNLFLYRFVIDGSQLIELTPDNIDKYVGKPVKLRSPMFCKGDTLCQHCAGTLFKRMQLKDVGLVASNLTGNLLNLSMKKMHDSTVKIDNMNIEKFITER